MLVIGFVRQPYEQTRKTLFFGIADLKVSEHRNLDDGVAHHIAEQRADAEVVDKRIKQRARYCDRGFRFAQSYQQQPVVPAEVAEIHAVYFASLGVQRFGRGARRRSVFGARGQVQHVAAARKSADKVFQHSAYLDAGQFDRNQSHARQIGVKRAVFDHLAVFVDVVAADIGYRQHCLSVIGNGYLQSGIGDVGKVYIRAYREAYSDIDIVDGLYREPEIAESRKYRVVAADKREYRRNKVCHVEQTADGVVETDLAV